MIMLSPFLISFFLTEFIILIFSFIAFFWALKISLEYNILELNKHQYDLAQKGYLVSTIIKFILFLKLPLFLFFIWSMDWVSQIVPGAMCAVGVLDATDYGSYMLILKVINLFLLSGWLLVQKEDSLTPTSKYMQTKFRLFQPLFLLLLLEFILEFSHFSGIRLDVPAPCCSVIFAQTNTNEISFFHKDSFILSVFIVLFIFNLLSAFFKKPIFLGVFSLSFMLSTIYAIIRFFSPYIYELPTHKCPFCMLQADYNYIGYVIYILLFLGTIPGFFALILNFLKIKISNSYYYFSIIINFILFSVLISYPLKYYFKFGVWL